MRASTRKAAKSSSPSLPESLAERVKRLRAVKEFRIEVPHYTRDAHGNPTAQVDVMHFPPRGTTPYTFEQACDLLTIFSQRWTGNGQSPPPEVEPVAIEIGWVGVRPDPRRFTLRDVFDRLTPLPVAADDDEDDADRWLRERGGGDRFLDL